MESCNRHGFKCLVWLCGIDPIVAHSCQYAQPEYLHSNLGNQKRKPRCSECTKALRRMKCYTALHLDAIATLQSIRTHILILLVCPHQFEVSIHQHLRCHKSGSNSDCRLWFQSRRLHTIVFHTTDVRLFVRAQANKR